MTLAEGGIDLFIPETYDIVWSLIILVIVAVFFYKFFMPKFNAIFDERAAKIEGNIAKAEQAKKDADEAKAKYEAQLSTARVDAAKIRDDARAERPTSSPTPVLVPSPMRLKSPLPRSARSNPSSSRPSSRSRARSVLLPPRLPARSSVPSWKTTTCSPR